ncbi:hypothetical protein BH09BAC1_BH09BAC1_18240 [soil metagenome]
MKTSPYLHFILTIIAINLTLITLKQFDVIPSAYAAGTLPPNSQAATDVNIVSINGQSIYNGLIPINIKDIETTDKLAVEVKGWQTYDVPQVDIKRVSTSDKLPVEVKNSYVYIKNY